MVPKLTFIFDRKKVGSKNRAASVELKISANKTRKYISTGIKLYPREWSGGFINSYRSDFKELNEQLRILMQKCSDIIARQMDEGRLDVNAIPNLMKEEMMQTQTFIDYARERSTLIRKKVAPGTWEHYELWFRFMKEWGKIIYFTDITERNVEKLDEELRKRGLKKVSRWSYHKILKTFIIKAMKEGLVKKNPYEDLDIKRGNESGCKRYLTPEEFHRIEKAHMPTESLEKVRDLFVFQTYTMMSYQDLCKFSLKNCTKMHGQTIYKAKREKTKVEFVIALMKPCLDILKKYNGKLPIISNVKYNLYLKAMAQNAKIEKPISTHWSRHTGATMLLNEGGLPMHVVQHILGHASIRETEKTYAKVLDSTIVDSMAGFRPK